MKDRFVTNHLLPHDRIPPADQAWEAMRRQLDEQLPGKSVPLPSGRQKKSGLILLLLLLFMASFFWLTGHHGQAVFKQSSITPDPIAGAGVKAGTDENRSPANTSKSLLQTQHNSAGDGSAQMNIPLSGRRKEGSVRLHYPKKEITAMWPGNWLLQPSGAGMSGDRAAVVRKKAPQILPSDSSAANQPEPDPEDWGLQAGLQWNAQIPISNAQYLFSGVNGNAAPYQLLLPALWLSVQHKRSLFSLEINPFFTNLVPNKPFEQYSVQEVADSVLVTTHHNKTLRKLFGLQAGLGFSHQLRGAWWIGGGLQGQWWSGGLGTDEQREERAPLNNPAQKSQTDKTITDQLKGADWDRFYHFQLSLHAELLYRKGIWQTGARLSLPMMPLAKIQGPVTPMRAELIFRLTLFSNSPDKKEKLFVFNR